MAEQAGQRSQASSERCTRDNTIRMVNEQLRRDVEAYRRLPQTTEERALANFAAPSGLVDDVDWAALYADEA